MVRTTCGGRGRVGSCRIRRGWRGTGRGTCTSRTGGTRGCGRWRGGGVGGRRGRGGRRGGGRWWGRGGGSYNGGGSGARTADVNNPEGVAVDGAGNLYIADTTNWLVRKVDVVTGLISAIAGTGVNAPQGVAVDGAGNLFIADTGNN